MSYGAKSGEAIKYLFNDPIVLYFESITPNICQAARTGLVEPLSVGW